MKQNASSRATSFSIDVPKMKNWKNENSGRFCEQSRRFELESEAVSVRLNNQIDGSVRLVRVPQAYTAAPAL